MFFVSSKRKYEKSIQQYYEFNNSKAFDPHRLLLNLAGKMKLKRSDKMLLYRILTFIIHGKI